MPSSRPGTEISSGNRDHKLSLTQVWREQPKACSPFTVLLSHRQVAGTALVFCFAFATGSNAYFQRLTSGQLHCLMSGLSLCGALWSIPLGEVFSVSPQKDQQHILNVFPLSPPASLDLSVVSTCRLSVQAYIMGFLGQETFSLLSPCSIGVSERWHNTNQSIGGSDLLRIMREVKN